MIKELIYNVLDLFTLGKGVARTFTNNTVRIPTRYYKYFRAEYEQENLSIINSVVKKGMNVIDVGAHIGLMSSIFGKKVGHEGKVYAFEPTPTTFGILEKTISINKLSGTVIPVNAALSVQSGETTFYISDNSADNSNSLVDNKRTDRKELGIRVKLFSIDDFAGQEKMRSVDFIKIDAEGAELQVLKGAQKTITGYSPVIILALHPSSINNFGDSLAEIWDFIKNSGYKVHFNSKEMEHEDFISRKGLFDVLLTRNN